MTIPQREGKEIVMEHTPFPWTVQKTSQTGQSLLVGGDIKAGNLISLQMSTANANIITEAVNSHESLKQLLKSAHEIIKILEYKSMDSDGKMCECYFCTDDVYMKTHKSDCIVGKWLASYGEIKGE